MVRSVEGQAEGHGGEDVDLDEGLAAGVVGAEGVLPSPFGGEGGEVVRQAGACLVQASVRNASMALVDSAMAGALSEEAASLPDGSSMVAIPASLQAEGRSEASTAPAGGSPVEAVPPAP